MNHSDITYASRFSKSTRIGVFHSLTLSMKQSLKIDSNPMEVSHEIAWSPKAWGTARMICMVHSVTSPEGVCIQPFLPCTKNKDRANIVGDGDQCLNFIY